MKIIEEKISQISSEIIEKSGFFVVDLVFRGTESKRVIEIFVDGETNLSADHCAKISREIISEIERLKLIEAPFRLDVSSPGVERPLKFLKQFHKHVNRNFEITYRQALEEKKFIGRLLSIQDNYLNFLINNKDEITLSFDDIIQAKVLISFS
ncbi:MAG: hypothetical protein HXY49_06525 [Ignavibacteriaceae bacterium]|nr:hypothetical protein [Ignavibacteriaceae bacterium]